MPKKVPLHVRLPGEMVERLRADARRSGRTLDAVMTVICRDFLTAWNHAERGRFYATEPAKKLGAPIREVE